MDYRWILIAMIIVCASLFGPIGCGDDDDDDTVVDADDDSTDDDDDDSADDDDDDDDTAPVNPYLNPDQMGPYIVGNTSFFLEDQNRALSCGEGNRRLVVEAWYPASDDADQYAENTLSDFFLDMQDEVREYFEELGEPQPDNYGTGTYRDAPVHPAATSMPLLVFSHGFSGARFQNYSMSAWLASHGYLVVSPDHTCNAQVAPFPDGIIVFSILNTPFTLSERIGDTSFLIDEFTLNTPEIFEGRVDVDKVAIFGHSFGGFTMTQTIKRELRAKAMVQLAAFGLPSVPDTVTAPSMYMVGQQDKWMSPFSGFHDANRDNMPLPKWELSFMDTGHFAFSDLCVFSPLLAEDGNGCGTETMIGSDELFTNPTPDEMNLMISPYVTAFFGAILFDEPSLWDYLGQNHFEDWMELSSWEE